MYAIEFNTRITDGKIEVPKEYLSELSNNVRVIILNDKILNDIDKTPKPTSAKGIFKEYADIKLIKNEKEAWGEAVKEKHANN